MDSKERKSKELFHSFILYMKELVYMTFHVKLSLAVPRAMNVPDVLLFKHSIGHSSVTLCAVSWISSVMDYENGEDVLVQRLLPWCTFSKLEYYLLSSC